MKKLLRLSALLLITGLLAACTLPRDMGLAGAFEDHNETFKGIVSRDFLGEMKVSARMTQSRVACTGQAATEKRWNDSKGHCMRSAGSLTLTCDDGRRIVSTWKSSGGCSNGVGLGADQFGNRLDIWFDNSHSLVDGQLAAFSARKIGQPELPPMTKASSTPSAGGGVSGSGTGFFITDAGHFITNHHVVKGAKRISVRTPDGKLRPARLLREDPDHDLAIGTIDTATYALPFGLSRNPRRGDELVVLGYPLLIQQGIEQKAVFGRINATSGYKDDVRYFQMDAPIQSGNSGGPVLNDLGEVIGVATASLVRGGAQLQQRVTDVHYAVKIPYVMSMVRAEGLENKIRQAGRGRKMPMGDIAERLKDGVVMILVEN
mgnify:CR=1 FL=1|tara:strand:+ start:1975 stop:3099 length:1125 start_codon:yes stop_codon:yes gene_type:complete